MSTTIIPGPNVFRAISGSLFSSPINWSRGFVPTGSDVAMIADNCVIDISRTVGSLIVQPTFTASINTGLTLQVNNVINVMGQLSCSGAPNIISYAGKNIINDLLSGTSTFTYTGSINQSVAGGNYFNLTIRSISNLINAPTPSYIKRAIGNISVSGSLSMQTNTVLELDRFNLNISGSTGFAGGFYNRLKKSQPGNVVFNGLINYGASNQNQGIDFESGNPNVEVRNSIDFGDATPPYFNSGKGTWTFTTNPNQVIRYNRGASTLGRTWDAPIIISGALSLTASSDGSLDGRNFLQLNEPINGTIPSSTFFVDARVYFGTLRSAVGSMRTGSFDFTSSANSIIGYTFTDNYTLPYNYYRGLLISGDGGTKTITSSLSVSGSLAISNASTLELSSSNLNVSGSTTIALSGPRLTKSGPGTVTFRGPFNIGLGSTGNAGVNFSVGNPSRVEFQNGINLGDSNSVIFNLGTGSTHFTTNNQNLSLGSTVAATMSFYGPISIENIAVTNSFTNPMYLFAPMNGTTAGSIFKNDRSLYFANSASLNGSFLTGALDLSTVGNIIGVGGNYDGTIPTRFSSPNSLTILGSGTKSLSSDMYVSSALAINNPGLLELSSSNLIISGTSAIAGFLSKSGPGYVAFYNPLTGPTLADSINFSRGNPTVEFRNGFTLGTNHDFNVLRTGTGSWIFTTNNQTIRTHLFTDFYISNFDAPLIVSGAINLNVFGHFYFNRPFNGTSPSSTITNSGKMYINFTSSLMPTGTFDYLSTSSLLGFIMPESYTIPSGSYRGLFISGSGIKYTSGSLIVSGNLSIAGNSQLELGNFDLTVTGSVVPDLGSLVSSKLTKSGSGNVIFNGRLSVAAASRSVDFSLGNPTVECRNGIYAGVNNVIDCLRTGTGSWTFTTNNQILQPHIFSTGPYSFIFDAPLTISGAITVTANSTFNAFYISRSLNGTEAASRFINNGVVYYYASQQPMLTGSVDFSSSLNTFIYASGSQDIKGGIYRNLTLISGSKTLQGNVSVLNTLATSSVTINLNGFTLTNP